jgi:hypothetical protein
MKALQTTSLVHIHGQAANNRKTAERRKTGMCKARRDENLYNGAGKEKTR